MSPDMEPIRSWKDMFWKVMRPEETASYRLSDQALADLAD